MPPGGVAELRRRKLEVEKAAARAVEEENTNESTSEAAVEQKSGELQHVSVVNGQTVVICFLFAVLCINCFVSLSGLVDNTPACSCWNCRASLLAGIVYPMFFKFCSHLVYA